MFEIPSCPAIIGTPRKGEQPDMGHVRAWFTVCRRAADQDSHGPAHRRRSPRAEAHHGAPEGYGWSKVRGDAVARQTEGGGIDGVPRLGAARPRKACDLERGGPWG